MENAEAVEADGRCSDGGIRNRDVFGGGDTAGEVLKE